MKGERVGDSLKQPSPFPVYPTVASNGSPPPFSEYRDTPEYKQARIQVEQVLVAMLTAHSEKMLTKQRFDGFADALLALDGILVKADDQTPPTECHPVLSFSGEEVRCRACIGDEEAVAEAYQEAGFVKAVKR